jgi:hypothetical protein
LESQPVIKILELLTWITLPLMDKLLYKFSKTRSLFNIEIKSDGLTGQAVGQNSNKCTKAFDENS